MKQIRAAYRFTAFMVLTFGIYALWYLFSFFVKDQAKWRQWTLLNWSRGFAAIAKMKIEISGTPPAEPFFLVSNHVSYMDIAAFRSSIGGIFVTKGEIEGWFLAGKMVGDMGMIFIKRQNRRDILRAGAKVLEKLDAGESVIVFPEGTSTKGETVLPFNAPFLEFAAQTDFPVSYASITYRIPNSEQNPGEIICWWQDDLSMSAHMWRLFQVKNFTATITFGDQPIRNNKRKILARELHEAVLNIFVPVS